MKLTLADIISLSKSGYKKKDIDELLSMEIPEESEELESIQEDESQSNHQQELKDDDEESIKYKEENERLKAQLKELQEMNRNKDSSDNSDSPEERQRRIMERAKKFM